jgi:hemolysin III
MWEATRQLWDVRDPVSTATHAAACLWSLYATGVLWRLCRGQPRKQWSLACFGVSMILLYAASALYHAPRLSPEALKPLQLIDHSAIYTLIAGTYTPAFAVLIPRRWLRRLLLAGIWALAIAGIACKWSIASVPYPVTISLYLGMGWFGLLAIVELVRAVGWGGMCWGLGGGVLYTLGGIADWMQWPILYPGFFGYHEFFHICAMAGTFCHFILMVRYVVPYDAGPAPGAEETPALFREPQPAFHDQLSREERSSV